MKGIKAKPLAFLIGFVLLGVSVYGFFVTSPDSVRDPKDFYGLSAVGVVLSAILIVYGVVPSFHVGREGELGETLASLAQGGLNFVTFPFRLIVLMPVRILLRLPLLFRIPALVLILGGFGVAGYYVLLVRPTYTYYGVVAPSGLTRSQDAAPTPPATPRGIRRETATPEPALQLGAAYIATGKGPQLGYTYMTDCRLGYPYSNKKSVAQGIRVTIVDSAILCNPNLYQVRLPDSRTLLWFSQAQLTQIQSLFRR